VVCLYHAGLRDVVSGLCSSLGLELGYGTFVFSLGLVSFWVRLGWAERIFVGRWLVGSVLVWFGGVGLGTRTVENEITPESAYLQH